MQKHTKKLDVDESEIKASIDSYTADCRSSLKREANYMLCLTGNHTHDPERPDELEEFFAGTACALAEALAEAMFRDVEVAEIVREATIRFVVKFARGKP